MIYKTLHRKLKIEQPRPHYKPGINSSAPELCSHCGRVNLSDKRTYPQKNITDTKNNIYNILSRTVWWYQRGN